MLYKRHKRRQALLRILTVLLIFLAAVGVFASLRNLIVPPVEEEPAESRPSRQVTAGGGQSEKGQAGGAVKQVAGSSAGDSLGVARREGGELHLSHGFTKQQSLGEEDAERFNRETEVRKVEIIELSEDVRTRLFGSGGGNDGGFDPAADGAGSAGEVRGSSGVESLKVRKGNGGHFKAATAFFRAYASLGVHEDWRKVIGFIRDPERTVPRMEAFYFNQAHSLPELARPEPTAVFHIDWQGTQILRCDVVLDSYEARVAFLVLGEGGEYKLDWESFVHYLPMPWEELLQKRPPGEIAVRVVVEPSKDYDAPFGDSRSFAAFSLGRILEDRNLLGYVERGTVIHRQLVEALGEESGGNGRRKTMVLSLRYPRNATSTRQVEITSVVSPSWLVP